MKEKFKNIINISFVLISLISGLILTSCKNDDPSDSPYVKNTSKTTVLIYAIATNSLSVNLEPDKKEMLIGAESINMNDNNVLVYQATYTDLPKLLKIVKTEEGYIFETLKEYSNDISSLSPERISEVIDYVLGTYESNHYGLIFWSHSSGAQPFMPALESEKNTAMRSFGQDINNETKVTTAINIDKLASLIPSDTFDYIWFDSCYMSNIESIYEFRGKCRYYIGYPTEVLDLGMPYNRVLPLITGSSPDPVAGATEFFKYYNDYPVSSLRLATVAVIDMNEIDELALLCKGSYSDDAYVKPYYYMCYTRGTTGPFYELTDYLKEMTPDESLEAFSNDLERILAKCVIYKGATERDFNGSFIDQERYSGLSCHIYDWNDDSLKENYYKSLSWYKTVMGE